MGKIIGTISEAELEDLYLDRNLSMQQIADVLHCSLNKVNYWMLKHDIPKRSRRDVNYIRRYPNGDPFCFKKPTTAEEILLYGLGMGLFWGEGNKADKNSVRLGNTDPSLIKAFVSFLVSIYSIDPKHLRFGLQIFTDINPDEALAYWKNELKVKDSQFYKITVTISGSIGTYRKKSKYGVVTVYYHNTKLRNLLMSQLADIAQG